MTQLSGPVNKRPFRVDEFRYLIGNEPGIKEDMDGTAYDLVLSTNSDEAVIGSATEDSITVVGGGDHVIPKGAPERIVIPEPVNGARTDLIVIRYDPAWAFVPAGVDPLTWVGPCRLHRIAGTEGSGVPPYDDTPPGIEDEVIWQVTRVPGKALTAIETTVVDRRVRTGPNVNTDTLANAPKAPLGTVLHLDSGESRVRALDAQGSPFWRITPATGDSRYVTLAPGLWGHDANPLRYYTQGDTFTMEGGIVNLAAGPLSTAEATLGTIDEIDAPSARSIFPATARLTGAGPWVAANVVITPNGDIRFNLSQGIANTGTPGGFILSVGSCSWRMT